MIFITSRLSNFWAGKSILRHTQDLRKLKANFWMAKAQASGSLRIAFSERRMTFQPARRRYRSLILSRVSTSLPAWALALSHSTAILLFSEITARSILNLHFFITTDNWGLV